MTKKQRQTNEEMFDNILNRTAGQAEARAWSACGQWLIAQSGEHFVMGQDQHAKLLRSLGQQAKERGEVIRAETLAKFPVQDGDNVA